MVREKYQKIMSKVLKMVKEEEPVSTSMVAKKMNVNWATAQRSLYELQADGKIRGKKVSGRCIWIFKKKSK
jgi:ribosomal protein S25